MPTSLFKQSNVIDADHQNSCLFTNKGNFSSPLWVLIGVLVNFHAQYFTNSSNYTLEIDFNHQFILKSFDPYVPLTIILNLERMEQICMVMDERQHSPNKKTGYFK